MMRALVSAIGVLVALGFMTLSAAINWRYGLSLGRDATDQTIYAALSVLCDIAKALSPFFCWWAIERRRPFQAVISGLFWAACTIYSLSSAAGFVELNTTTQAGKVSSGRDESAELEASSQRKRQQLERLGTVTPAGVLTTRVNGLHTDARWASTKFCTDMRSRQDKSFCDELVGLVGEREKAEASERLESEIATVRARLNQLGATSQSKSADPRVGLVTRLFRSEQSKVQLFFSLLFVVVLEIGSGLGLFIATSHGQLSTRPRTEVGEPETGHEKETLPHGNVAKFARACLVGKEDATIGSAELYGHYRAWCSPKNMSALDLRCFAKSFTQLATLIGVTITDNNGELVFSGICAEACRQ